MWDFVRYNLSGLDLKWRASKALTKEAFTVKQSKT